MSEFVLNVKAARKAVRQRELQMRAATEEAEALVGILKEWDEYPLRLPHGNWDAGCGSWLKARIKITVETYLERVLEEIDELAA